MISGESLGTRLPYNQASASSLVPRPCGEGLGAGGMRQWHICIARQRGYALSISTLFTRHPQDKAMATRTFETTDPSLVRVPPPWVTNLIRSSGSRELPQPKVSQPKLPSAKSELSKEDVTCTVCLDRLKDPRLLPCLHAYCRTCLEEILSKSKEKKRIVCPQCRSNHAVPSGGVEALPSDMLLESALKFYSLKDEPKKAVSCNMCIEDDPATVYCPTCGKFLCAFCSKAHGRMLEYRDHKTTALNKLDAEAMNQFERPHHCSTHQGEPLKLYCEACRCLICRDCTIVDHHDHKFGFFDTIRPKIEREVGELIQTVKLKQQELEANLMLVKDIENDQGVYSTKLEAEINKAFDSYIKTLESRRKQLLEQAEATKTSNLKQVWGQKDFLEVTLASLRSVLKYSERLCHCPSDTQMLAMSTQASQCLENLKKTKWVPSDLKLAPSLTFKGANEASLTRAGDLNETTINALTVKASVVQMPSSPKLGQRQQVIIRIDTKCGFIPAFIPSVQITRISHYDARHDHEDWEEYAEEYAEEYEDYDNYDSDNAEEYEDYDNYDSDNAEEHEELEDQYYHYHQIQQPAPWPSQLLGSLVPRPTHKPGNEAKSLDCNVKYSGNGLWTIEFVPEQNGDYNISFVVGGKTLLNHKIRI